MPSVQGTDRFDHAIDSGFYTDGFFSSGGSPDAVTTPLYHLEPASLRIVTDGNNIGARHNLSGSPGIGWAAFALQVNDLSPVSVLQICNFSANAGASVASLLLGATGLDVSVGGATGTETAISADTWYWIELFFDVRTDTHAIYLWIDNVFVTSASVAASAGSVTFHQLLSASGDPSGFTNYYGKWMWGSAHNLFDRLFFSDTAWLTA